MGKVPKKHKMPIVSIFIILYWDFNARECSILQDEDSNDCSGNKIFFSYDEAFKYTEKWLGRKCWRIIEL
jgi:hypothetical protein